MKEVENVVSEEVRKMNIVCLRIRNNLEKTVLMMHLFFSN